MRKILLSLPAILAFLLAGTASAQLSWEQKVIDLKVTSHDPVSVAHFKFKNTGSYPVKILAVVTSCGCTTAGYPHDPIQPGVSGEIIGTFNIGGRRGLQPRTLTVETDDQKAGTKTVLTMLTRISELLRIKPSFVEWDRNETPAAKQVDIEILDNFPIKGLKVISTNPVIRASIQTVTPQKEYTLVLAPVDTSAPLKTVVALAPDYPSDHPEQFLVHIRIK